MRYMRHNALWRSLSCSSVVRIKVKLPQKLGIAERSTRDNNNCKSLLDVRNVPIQPLPGTIQVLVVGG